MIYTRIEPHPSLLPFIECYWTMESDDTEPHQEKIIPDGFTELVFNFADVYRSNIEGTWQTQTKYLLAGQIRSYFFLENTGKTRSAAAKLRPEALTRLFGLRMDEFTDKVVSLENLNRPEFLELGDSLEPLRSEVAVKDLFDSWFLAYMTPALQTPVSAVIDAIFERNGAIAVHEMAGIAGVSERQLERLFKKFIGLAPKYYARVIRFGVIFRLVQEKAESWSEIVYRSGYYDQSHFIRDFKAFAGEDPSSYYFDEKNMANFFLNR